ncbi:MAG: trypsin-like serine peptidase [Promethearchaeota archaeon]
MIGDDDRVRVTPTNLYPWSTIVKLYITWGSYNTFGTGAIIDKKHVLTAGHCVYSHSRGGWADTIKVVPGADNGYEPYGHAWAINMRSYFGWINDADGEHDFAVLTLDRDIGLQTGWMELYTAIPSSSIYTGLLNTAGYPYDLGNGKNMYWTSDDGNYANEHNHWYFLDTAGGQSGSPIWRYDGVNRFILSIHTTSYVNLDLNYGTRINRNRRDCINNWITADDISNNKPDLASESNSFSGFTPLLGGSGLTNFDVWCKIRNVGTISPSSFTVSYYASPDTTFSEGDYLIGTDVISSLSLTVSTDSIWSGVLPDYIPSGSYYIGWIIDVSDDISEFNENNNWNFIWDYRLQIDATSPTNPSTCDQIIGSTISNIWQNEVNDPSFNWSIASDSQSGLEGYYYYWGPDSNGTSTAFTVSPDFRPSSVNSGINYLRVKSKDNIGNNASWTTLYIFKYDDTAPENPINCNQLADSTESDVWQNSVNDPFFIWSEGFDSHTDVEGYYYYWGSNPYGTSNSFTKNTILNPHPVSPGEYYLRVSTKDSVGNVAPWKTLYIFKYYACEEEPLNNPNERANILMYVLAILTGIFGGLILFKVKERLRK